MKFSHRHISWNTSMKSVRQRTKRATLCLATANLTLQQCVTQIKWMSSNAAFWQFMKSPLLCCSPSDIRGFDQALLSKLTKHTLTHIRGTCGFVVVVVIVVFCLTGSFGCHLWLVCSFKNVCRAWAAVTPQPLMNKLCNMSVGVEWRASVIYFFVFFSFFPFFLPGY